MNEETELFEEYLHFAKTSVREAALLVKGMSHQATVRYAKELGDLVTDGDLAVHEYIGGQISYAYPDHHIRLLGYDSYTQSQGSCFVVFEGR